MSNIVRALLHCGTVCKTAPLYQYDYGQILQIVGVELPEAYEVHFSNAPHGVATTQIGSADGVTIPDMYLLSGDTIYAWLFLHAGPDDGETEYSITIPVVRRASIGDDPPTPVEQSAITQAIAALNEAVTQTGQDVEAADAAKAGAESAQLQAEGYAEYAAGQASDAMAYAQDAHDSEIAAKGAQVGAEAARDAAQAALAEFTGVTAQATTLVPGSSATASYDAGVLTLGIPQGVQGNPGQDGADGQDGHSPVVTAFKSGKITTVSVDGAPIAQISDGENGQDGQDGQDGYSPAASVTKSGSTATITITDKYGATTATVSDGADGADGQDGADGFSPIATVSKSGSTATITITDAQGTTTAEVSDGVVDIDDTAGAGDTDKVWSADKLAPIAQDVSDLKSAIDQKAPAIWEDASGAIASFSDGAEDMPLREAVVSVDPVQDLHGYDHPWPAGGGVNKFVTGDAIGVYASTGATYGLTITCDGATETVTISGTPNWTTTTAKSFRAVSTRSDSYYGDAPVDHDYSGLSGKWFVVSKSSNVSAVDADAIINTNGTIGVSVTNTDLGDVNIVLKLVLYEGSTAPTAWSPYSNVCPISGWTGCNVAQAGKNLFALGVIAEEKTVDGVTYTPMPDGCSIKINGTNTRSTEASGVNIDFGEWGKTPLRFDGNVYRAVLSFSSDDGTQRNDVYIRGGYFAPSGIPYQSNVYTYLNGSATETGMPYGLERLRTYIRTAAGATFNNLVVHIQYELSPTATAYEPYSGFVYPVTFPSEAGTVYGGSIDLVRGKLTVTHGQIASYAGETLPGAWISDRDVYAAGTSPSTGAQVVYAIAAPIVYDLDPVAIRTLASGHINNIWADTGDTSVTYPADTETFIRAQSDIVETVSGTTPSIVCEAGKRYVCGTVATISITPPSSGICDVVFTCGSTAAVLTVPNTVKWPGWFNPAALATNTTYELSIMDGTLGAVGVWT